MAHAKWFPTKKHWFVWFFVSLSFSLLHFFQWVAHKHCGLCVWRMSGINHMLSLSRYRSLSVYNLQLLAIRFLLGWSDLWMQKTRITVSQQSRKILWMFLAKCQVFLQTEKLNTKPMHIKQTFTFFMAEMKNINVFAWCVFHGCMSLHDVCRNFFPSAAAATVHEWEVHDVNRCHVFLRTVIYTPSTWITMVFQHQVLVSTSITTCSAFRTVEPLTVKATEWQLHFQNQSMLFQEDAWKHSGGTPMLEFENHHRVWYLEAAIVIKV